MTLTFDISMKTLVGKYIFGIKRLRILALLLFCTVLPGSFFFFQQPVWAKDITLAWEPNTELDLAGYKIYYKPGGSGGQNPAYYSGKEAAEGHSPIVVPPREDENPNAGIVQFTLHGLDEATTYCFVVTAYNRENVESRCSREVFVIGNGDVSAPYNAGWGISAGDLKGFMLLYNNLMDPGVVPTLGSPEDIPNLNLPDLSPVGTPLNLQPSGAVFRQPVWIELPCPGYSDMNHISLALYDDNVWVKVWDGPTGMLTAAGEGWLEVDPEYNAYEDPQTIVILAKHFTGLQAAVSSQSTESGGGGGGCFISTMVGQREKKTEGEVLK
ncbi:MAG: fibronectin type III domain-containing protein [Deltaproteobacteria bacterium]|nr:fibronectin type III domain-containing protein [Deltaproteobacteria bacterium]